MLSAMTLYARLPDGSKTAIGRNPVVFGRGRPATLTDPCLSREHIQLCSHHEVEGVLELKVLGMNPVLIEVKDPSKPDGTWDFKDFVEHGMDTMIGPGTRFYVAGKCETTTFTVDFEDPFEDELTQQGAATAMQTSSPAIFKAYTQSYAYQREEQPGNSAKRARLEAAAPGQQSSGARLPPPSATSTPFSLFWVRGLPSHVNQGCLGVRLRHLVSGPIRLAWVSNYMVDMAWLVSALPQLFEAQRVVVVHGEHGAHAEMLRRVAEEAGVSDRLVLHAAPLPIQFGTHHSKAFVLQYDTGVRVIVHTANLIYADCNSKCQALWWQDFPLCGAASAPSSPFQSSLLSYLQALRMPQEAGQAVMQAVRSCDMSSARGHLVGSVPGYHRGQALAQWGHMRLRQLLSQEPLAPEFRAQFSSSSYVAQFSSLGSLDEKWLMNEFGASMAACAPAPAPAAPPSCATAPPSSTSATWLVSSGPAVKSTLGPVSASRMAGRQADLAPAGSSSPADPSAPDAAATAGKASPSGQGQPGQRLAPEFSRAGSAQQLGGATALAGARPGLAPDQLRLVWPTVEQVRNSLEGWAAGASIPGSEKNVGKAFLARHWCRFGGEAVGRERVMPHIKTFVRYSGQRLAWVLVSSHNLSKAAWGMLQNQGGQLMVRSYELGVLATAATELAYWRHPHCGFTCTPLPPELTMEGVEGGPGGCSSRRGGCSSNEGGPATTEEAGVAGGEQAQGQGCGAGVQEVQLWHMEAREGHMRAAPSDPAAAASTVRRVYVPLPYPLPPAQYSPGDRPWMCDVDYPGLDCVGRYRAQGVSMYGLEEGAE